jgi:hypothetical protein
MGMWSVDLAVAVGFVISVAVKHLLDLAAEQDRRATQARAAPEERDRARRED